MLLIGLFRTIEMLQNKQRYYGLLGIFDTDVFINIKTSDPLFSSLVSPRCR
jgi:hypothetical protein